MGYGTGLTIWAAAMSVAGFAGAAQLCDPGKVTVSGDWGEATFTVDIADTQETRAKGLMFVAEMPLMQGMLFVFETPQHATFWMRNTLIPLDMLFADAAGRIVTVHANAVPLDETVIDGGRGITAVLEINGGLAARLGIEPGDLMRHPSFGPEAAAPCD